jgi:nucleoside-diphosphate-sugar epimerase
MHVFLTGASGYVGTATARALVAAGHQVSGLCRSASAAARVAGTGATPVLGDLAAPDAWAPAAAARHDAFVHAGFEYRADGSEADDVDRRAVAGMLAALAGRGGARLVYTSNAFLLADLTPRRDTPPLDEAVDPARATRPGRWRLDVERQVLDAGGAVVRVGAVYGGHGGSFPDVFAHAARTRTLAWVGAGDNRWSTIHHDDLAALYRTILEHDGAGVFHGVDGAPLTTRELMTIVARAVGDDVRAAGATPDEARALPYHASVLAVDLAMVTPRARALPWAPRVASFADGAAATWAALQRA